MHCFLLLRHIHRVDLHQILLCAIILALMLKLQFDKWTIINCTLRCDWKMKDTEILHRPFRQHEQKFYKHKIIFSMPSVLYSLISASLWKNVNRKNMFCVDIVTTRYSGKSFKFTMSMRSLEENYMRYKNNEEKKSWNLPAGEKNVAILGSLRLIANLYGEGDNPW